MHGLLNRIRTFVLYHRYVSSKTNSCVRLDSIH
jgi:hypothetical protein